MRYPQHDNHTCPEVSCPFVNMLPTKWPEKIGVIYSVAEMMQFCEPKPGKELAFVFIMFKLNVSMLLKTMFNSNIQGHLFFFIWRLKGLLKA